MEKICSLEVYFGCIHLNMNCYFVRHLRSQVILFQLHMWNSVAGHTFVLKEKHFSKNLPGKWRIPNYYYLSEHTVILDRIVTLRSRGSFPLYLGFCVVALWVRLHCSIDLNFAAMYDLEKRNWSLTVSVKVSLY